MTTLHEKIVANSVPIALEHLLLQSKTVVAEGRRAPAEAAAFRADQSYTILTPYRENVPAVAAIKTAIERSFGPTQQSTIGGFISFTSDSANRAALELLASAPIRAGGQSIDVYAGLALANVTVSDVLDQIRQYEVLSAAVNNGAINATRADIGSYFPIDGTDFKLVDQSGTEWTTRVKSAKISCGVREYVARENARLVAQGKAPVAIGDDLTFMRMDSDRYHVEISKNNPVLELNVLPTLSDYNCINVPEGSIGTYFPHETRPFPIQDASGQRWDTHVASNKISTGISSWLRRENQRLNSQGVRDITVGDSLIFTKQVNGVYTICVQKAEAYVGVRNT